MAETNNPSAKARGRGRLVVISGPSGVGKSTIVREALARTGAAYSVSVTTRRPRPGEVDGRDYRFASREAFEKMIADGALLEWAEVHGALYGTPRRPVEEALAAGRTVILEIDVQGGLQVRRKMPDATGVLIEPPSDAELMRRLAGRGTEGPEAVRRRFDKAKEEIRLARQSGAYEYNVVNDDLERATRQVVDILVQEPKPI